jgi:cell division protein FtsA
MKEIDSFILVSLDLGSSATKIVVGRPVSDREIEILGVGTSPNPGIKYGSVINIESTTRSITEALQIAELMSGSAIRSVVVNLSGASIRSLNETGMIAISNPDKTVSSEDVYRAIQQAQAIQIPLDEEILHVFSKEFHVDHQNHIKDPVGMTGVRLQADVHIILSGVTNLQNIKRCVTSAGLGIEDMVLSAVASSEAVLTGTERDYGVAVVDIGAGITDILVYREGGVAFSGTLPLGGNHITNDISIGLKIPFESAESIKLRYGNCNYENIDPTIKIELPGISGKPGKIIPVEELIHIIEPRVFEILEQIRMILERNDLKGSLTGGIILTGGASLMPGLEEMAEEVIGLSAVKAKPGGILGLSEKVSSPVYSTGVGLLRYMARNFSPENIQPTNETFTDREKWTDKFKRWMKQHL